MKQPEHRLDPFGPVVGVDPDVLTGAGSAVEQGMAHPVGALVELCVGEAAVTGDEGEPVGRGVDDAFEEVREVELHLFLGHEAAGYGRRVPFAQRATALAVGFGVAATVVVGGCGADREAANGFCAEIEHGHAAFDSVDKQEAKRALAEFDRVVASAPAAIAPT